MVQTIYSCGHLVVQMMMANIWLKSVKKHIPKSQSVSMTGLASEIIWEALRMINRICTRNKSQGTSLGQCHTYFCTQIIGTTQLQKNTYLFSQDFRVCALLSDVKNTDYSATITDFMLSKVINFNATFFRLTFQRGLSYD